MDPVVCDYNETNYDEVSELDSLIESYIGEVEVDDSYSPTSLSDQLMAELDRSEMSLYKVKKICLEFEVDLDFLTREGVKEAHLEIDNNTFVLLYDDGCYYFHEVI